MKRLPLYLLVFVLLFVSGCKSGGLELNEFNFVCPSGRNVTGLRAYEPTLENILNKSASHVVTGSVTSFKYDPISNLTYYDFTVDSVIVGELDHDSIVLTGTPQLLVSGKDYLLFLHEIDYSHLPFASYAIIWEWIIVVDRDGSLMRLEDPLTGELVPPFVDSNYNKLSELSKYLVETRDERIFQRWNPSRRHFFESADSLQELYELSDLVAEIQITSVNRTGLFTAGCAFNILQIHKGELPARNRVVLPGDITKGHYLVFLLVETRDDGARRLYLTTRQGSIVAVDTDEYRDFHKWLGNR